MVLLSDEFGYKVIIFDSLSAGGGLELLLDSPPTRSALESRVCQEEREEGKPFRFMCRKMRFENTGMSSAS